MQCQWNFCHILSPDLQVMLRLLLTPEASYADTLIAGAIRRFKFGWYLFILSMR